MATCFQGCTDVVPPVILHFWLAATLPKHPNSNRTAAEVAKLGLLNGHTHMYLADMANYVVLARILRLALFARNPEIRHSTSLFKLQTQL